jgi:hypothetical protein
MRWTLLAACAAIAATLWLPGEAAQPTPRDGAAAAAPAGTAGTSDEAISFDAYRDWRLNFIERRRSELAVQLSETDLPAARKARLEQIKAYYDWFAGLADSDRDRRFRQRFDRIDTNHDGRIDTAERAAWRDRQRAFYPRDRVAATHEPAEAAKQ